MHSSSKQLALHLFLLFVGSCSPAKKPYRSNGTPVPSSLSLNRSKRVAIFNGSGTNKVGHQTTFHISTVPLFYHRLLVDWLFPSKRPILWNPCGDLLTTKLSMCPHQFPSIGGVSGIPRPLFQRPELGKRISKFKWDRTELEFGYTILLKLAWSGKWLYYYLTFTYKALHFKIWWRTWKCLSSKKYLWDIPETLSA